MSLIHILYYDELETNRGFGFVEERKKKKKSSEEVHLSQSIMS